MRNRLIAAILGLCGAVTGVQAAPNVTSEITYDLASGRADYYFWNEAPPEVSYSTTFSFFFNVATLIHSRLVHQQVILLSCKFI